MRWLIRVRKERLFAASDCLAHDLANPRQSLSGFRSGRVSCRQSGSYIYCGNPTPLEQVAPSRIPTQATKHLLREFHPAHQLSKARIGSQGIEYRLDVNIHYPTGAILIGLVELFPR